jgi:preprotein translocase subunit SecG
VQTAYNILIFIALLVAVVFSVLVFITGKGDAMSGGGSIRTTFKGKASFDDYMSRMTLILGASFFALMLVIDGVSNRIDLASMKHGVSSPISSTKTPAPKR